VAKLEPSEPEASDRFGEWLSISGDTIVVGATGDDDKGANSGAAYVYRRISGSWTRE
jgi:hypothetical protein